MQSVHGSKYNSTFLSGAISPMGQLETRGCHRDTLWVETRDSAEPPVRQDSPQQDTPAPRVSSSEAEELGAGPTHEAEEPDVSEAAGDAALCWVEVGLQAHSHWPRLHLRAVSAFVGMSVNCQAEAPCP